MLNRLRQRTGDESGFTLIELLVVILIIGILAAIAIPSLLSQKSKAYAASAKQLASSAQTAAETIGTDNEGNYKEVSEQKINEYEKTIPTSEAAANGGAFLEKAGPLENNEGYYLAVKAHSTGEYFVIHKNSAGEVKRTCGTAFSATNGEATGEHLPKNGCATTGIW